MPSAPPLRCRAGRHQFLDRWSTANGSFTAAASTYKAKGRWMQLRHRKKQGHDGQQQEAGEDGGGAAPGAAPAAAPAPTAAAPAAPAQPAATKVTYAADTFFDFDKSVLKPAAKAKLDDLLDKIKSINLEVIIAIGHTDSVGSDEYNQKLSMRRSNAVKAYLVSKGVDKTRIYTEGKGESQPVADNKTKEGRAKNRRVEIEVVGTRKN